MGNLRTLMLGTTTYSPTLWSPRMLVKSDAKCAMANLCPKTTS